MITLLKGMKDEETNLSSRVMMMIITMMMAMFATTTYAGDTNYVYSPCLDAKVQRGDGFTFGIVFSDKKTLTQGNGPQFSPCDKRLDLSNRGAQFAMFRPKVDEISLLTINRSTSDSANSGGYMVAFSGQKYAARSQPIMFSDNNNTITSFTLVLEFSKGTLQNFFWKSFGCDSCPSGSICLNNQDCAVSNSKCQGNGGTACNIGVQLVFSGTDKNLDPLNSWYEVKNLRQYSLYGLYTNFHNFIIGPYQKFF